jgi:hypothetical protein
MEFEGARSKKMDANPVAVVEALIHINNQLQQHDVIFKSLLSLCEHLLTHLVKKFVFYLGCSWNVDLCPTKFGCSTDKRVMVIFSIMHVNTYFHCLIGCSTKFEYQPQQNLDVRLKILLSGCLWYPPFLLGYLLPFPLLNSHYLSEATATSTYLHKNISKQYHSYLVVLC